MAVVLSYLLTFGNSSCKNHGKVWSFQFPQAKRLTLVVVLQDDLEIKIYHIRESDVSLVYQI